MNDVLMIGGLHRNAGKTTFSGRVISSLAGDHRITAVKVTIFKGAHALETTPVLLPEERSDTGKDTARMLAAGAARVFWLKTDEPHMEEALSLLQTLRDGNPLLVESNTLRRYCRPSLFYLVGREGEQSLKESAREVMPMADRTLTSTLDPRGEVLYFPNPRLMFQGGKWIELS
ncbi:hypothetical protein KKF84_01020 [Myxococcota bacterium]|nr:hypothetical protein [Myxococcota bacterium]MBU1533867.1 hypothetical protein [Myxococcota bacterium]